MTDAEEQRARNARALLGDPTFTEAVGEVERRLLLRWADTAPGSVSVREEIWAQIHALQSVKAQLQEWVSGLDMAVAKADRQRR